MPICQAALPSSEPFGTAKTAKTAKGVALICFGFDARPAPPFLGDLCKGPHFLEGDLLDRLLLRGF